MLHVGIQVAHTPMRTNPTTTMQGGGCYAWEFKSHTRQCALTSTISSSADISGERGRLEPCKYNANTIWRKIYYSRFETRRVLAPAPWVHLGCTLGAGTKTHLNSRFCLQAILKKRGSDVRIEADVPQKGARDTRSIYLTPYKT